MITVCGIEYRIHLLTGFLTALGVADMIEQVKGSSFHLDTHQIKPGELFKWQGSYGAFTVSRDAIDSVAKYIRNQAVHHPQKSMIPD